ncbi:hypothetical protein BK816_00925 [Boudabousia tangfeifanii]|uniref:Uncharacterized protein n=1 Tax=Boudabousia tangfeifanii TaxID=1912795 RepID=A0A1D9MIK0_9ACTO|nr:hypothetical protein BK816_00925 [Boudabousia tangfeifanii]
MELDLPCEARSLLALEHLFHLNDQGVLTRDELAKCVERLTSSVPGSLVGLLAQVRLDFPALSSELLNQTDTNPND